MAYTLCWMGLRLEADGQRNVRSVASTCRRVTETSPSFVPNLGTYEEPRREQCGPLHPCYVLTLSGVLPPGRVL